MNEPDSVSDTSDVVDFTDDPIDHGLDTGPEIPVAQVASRSRPSLTWLLPVLAAVVVGVVLWQGAASRGPSITVSFGEAHGLRADDAVIFRGVPAGVVRAVRLDPSGTGVLADITLAPEAAMLASAGTRYWIVRPELSLTRVTGLDTLVGPRYIQAERPAGGERVAGAAPGDETGQTLFEGLPGPPPDLDAGLSVALRTERAAGVSVGTAIRFRGVRVGEVRTVELDENADAVILRAHIHPAHAHLVRTDSRFWVEGGTGVDFGWFSGFSVRSAPLESILTGEIAFATETPDAAAPAPGAVFELHDEPDRDWLEWAPALRPASRAPDG